jgi:hypothetical protein
VARYIAPPSLRTLLLRRVFFGLIALLGVAVGVAVSPTLGVIIVIAALVTGLYFGWAS